MCSIQIENVRERKGERGKNERQTRIGRKIENKNALTKQAQWNETTEIYMYIWENEIATICFIFSVYFFYSFFNENVFFYFVFIFSISKIFSQKKALQCVRSLFVSSLSKESNCSSIYTKFITDRHTRLPVRMATIAYNTNSDLTNFSFVEYNFGIRPKKNVVFL